MTHLTPHLNLTAYNTVLDAAGTLVYDFVNQTSGSETNQNLRIIDNFSASTSASLTMLSGSITALNNVVATQLGVTAGSTIAGQVDTLLSSGSYIPVMGVGGSPCKQLWIGSWKPTLNGGCSEPAQLVISNGGYEYTYDYLSFDITSTPAAYAVVPLPQDYVTSGSMYAQIYWTPNGNYVSASGAVVWGVHAVGIAPDNLMAKAATASYTTASATTAGSTLAISDFIPNIKISGSATAGNLVEFIIFRHAEHENDTYEVPAFLLGMMVWYPVAT